METGLQGDAMIIDSTVSGRKKMLERRFSKANRMKNILILVFLLSGLCQGIKAAEPAWSVDPSLYKYQMTFVGAVFINSVQQPGTGNILAAFSGSDCRGLTRGSYNQTTGYWTYYLTSYSDQNGENLDFKFYSSSEDRIYDLPQKSVFKADANSGEIFEPRIWSFPVLSGADISSFSLPGQSGSEIIVNQISITMSTGASISSIKASYLTSPGAIVKVGNIVQQSGITVNNFSQPVTYQVRSSDGSNTKTYTARIVSNLMNIVATVFTDSLEAVSASDTLYAYIRGELRGKSHSVAVPELNTRRFPISIINTADTGIISFRFYSMAHKTVIPLPRKIAFENHKSRGTNYNPVRFSSPELKGNKLFSYYVPGQTGETYYLNNEIRVVAPKGSESSLVSPVFKASAGAVVTILDSVQYSSITRVRFTTPLAYKVYSSDISSSHEYSIRMVSNRMKLTAAVYVDTLESASATDTLYAYIHGQLRGKAAGVYNSDIRSWRFPLEIYNPTDTGRISFRFYSTARKQNISIPARVEFKNNVSSGTIYNPVKFSLPILKGNKLFSYHVPGQTGETYYLNNEIRVVAPKGSESSLVSPVFKASAGAVVTILDSVQYSSITRVRFTTPLAYKVYSSDISSYLEYSIRLVSNRMKLTAAVYVDTLESASATDTLYAYIHGQLRGKAAGVYNSDIRSWRFPLEIYNPTDTGRISFRFYSTARKQNISIPARAEFKNNVSSGTIYNPVKLTTPVLNRNDLYSFSIPAQIGNTYFKGNEVRIVVKPGAETGWFIPQFQIAAGATAYVNDSVQYSSITRLKFTTPVTYTIKSADNSNMTSYKVSVVNFNERVVASVILDGSENNSPRDTLYAYTNGFILGKANPVYIDSIKRFRFDIRTYSHTGNSVVSFKYYRYSTGELISFSRTLSFNESFDIGTLYDPFQLCNPELDGNSLTSFTLRGQEGQTFYDGDTLRIIVPRGTDMHKILPDFIVSEGAILKMDGKVVYSGLTPVDVSKVTDINVFSSDTLIRNRIKLKVVDFDMDLISTVFINGLENSGPNDTLYAYTNKFLNGKAKLQYVPSIGRYRFFIKVKSHTAASEISFKYYSSATRSMKDLINIIPYRSYTDTGSVDVPIVLYDTELRDALILQYSIPGQVGETIWEGNNIKVILPPGAPVNSILPEFETSPGSHIFSGGKIQYTGTTQASFEAPVEYVVYSASFIDSSKYTVSLIMNSLNELEASAIISPNNDGINDTWGVEGYEKLRESEIYIVNSYGSIVFKSFGYQIPWDGTKNGTALPPGVYYYIIKSSGNIVASGSITLLK